MSARIWVLLVLTPLLAASLAACGPKHPTLPEANAAPAEGFRSQDCNGVVDADITAAVGRDMFTKTLVSDVGCFWQEDSVFGTVGAGMGISTWWYRGSDMDTERRLEQQAGRTLTELSFDGHKGFRAFDTNACSIYVTKGDDVITWSIQTLNPAALPNLCTIVERLARISQDRVN